MAILNQKNFYLSGLKQFGITPQALRWKSKKHQQLRFEILLKALPEDIHNYTIADAGCGFGDFSAFLHVHNKVPKHYVGLENIVEFYTIAKEKNKGEFLLCDILKDPLPQADFYICSGALNTLGAFDAALFIEKMLLFAKKGVVFNYLYGTTPKKPLYALDEKYLDKYKEKIYFLKKDYIAFDKTVGIKTV